jgi:cytoskeletal protein CcmA (bactofilin family)
MFKNNGKEAKGRVAENGNGSINIIGLGTTINGDIESNGDIRIDGTVKGTITSKAKVVIGKSSVIDGDVEAQNADISGKVNGKLSVAQTLLLKPTSFINGDIVVNKLVVESGAEFNGKCTMLSSQRVPLSSKEKTQNARTTEKALEA